MIKMYIHIFYSESGYSKTLLQILENHIDIENHLVVFGVRNKSNKNVLYSGKLKPKYLTDRKDLFFVLKNIKKADWIYIHLLQYNPTLLFWASQPKLLAKSTWIVWGSDIYAYFKQKNSLRTRIYEGLRRTIISKLPEIAAFVKEDFELIQKLYKTKAEYIPILYPIPINTELLDRFETEKKDETTVFLIGNSGDKSNLHLEMIELLAPLKSENIEVICPLSYGGSKEYRESVIQTGNQKLGGKFVPLLEYMDVEKYTQLLVNVDIALMNHKRQQGLGNILALLYVGKKVFLRSDITSFSFFERHDCKVFDIGNVAEMNFEQLIEIPVELKKNKEIVKRIISEENYLKLWLNLLNKH